MKKNEEPTDELSDLISDVTKVLEEIGRAEDFISVLNKIADGTLRANIAFHLLLDVGQVQNCRIITKLFALFSSLFGNFKISIYLCVFLDHIYNSTWLNWVLIVILK